MEELQIFLANHARIRQDCIHFLKNKFRNTGLDHSDITSEAVLKILTKASLSKNLSTLIYVANCTAIDRLRKRKREVLVADFVLNPPLSMSCWDNDDLEKKHQIELISNEITHLSLQNRVFLEHKYHTSTFANFSNDEIMAFKNKPRMSSNELAAKFNVSPTAFRQANFRAINQLRARLSA